MGRPLRSIAVRPRLEISFEDRLQDELQRTLNHAVADCGNRKNADLAAPVLRNLLLPHRHGLIRVLVQFVLNLFQKTPHSTLFDGIKRDSIDPRCTMVVLGHLVGFLERFHFADVNVQSPKAPSWFLLRRYVSSPPQVLQTDRGLCHLTLASRWLEFVHNSRASSLHGHYPASPLLLAPPPPSRRPPTSRCHRLYGFPAPRISPWDEEGFSSCSMCPCHRAVAIAPPERLVASVSLQRSMLPSPPQCGFGLWGLGFRGHLCVHFRYSPMTRSPSRTDDFVGPTSRASFPPHMRPWLQEF